MTTLLDQHLIVLVDQSELFVVKTSQMQSTKTEAILLIGEGIWGGDGGEVIREAYIEQDYGFYNYPLTA